MHARVPQPRAQTRAQPHARTHLPAAALALVLATAACLAQHAQRYDRAYQRRDFARAARIAEKWCADEPANSFAAYNAACAFALAGRHDEALDWIERCAELGFAGVRSFEEDADLAAIRDTERFRAALDTVRAAAARRFERFKRDAERERILTIVPESVDPASPAPLILVLHGSGGTPAPLAELHRATAERLGAILAFPSAVRPGPSGGFSWTFRDESAWWVLRAVERLAAEHDVDADRVVLSGFSQGANVALAVGLKHPDRFAGLVPVGGHWEPDAMPITPSETKPRVQLLIGQRDPAASTFRKARRALEQAGFEVRLRTWAAVGHAYPRRPTKDLVDAFSFVLSDD